MNRILAVLFVVFAFPAAQAQSEKPKPAKIFTGDDVKQVSLSAPWRTIGRRKTSGGSWEGQFSYMDTAGDQVSIPVTITTRGLTRLRVCDFPPLRIDFDKEAAKGTAFRGAGNLKLVTHCLTGSRFEQYYIKEYIGYQLYNQVTEKSFRVQGLDVTYIDSERSGKANEKFAFLIEDPDDVAKRNDLVKLKVDSIEPSDLDPEQTTRYMLFQYLIANLDWSVLSAPSGSCCHNARLIGLEGQTPVYPVPYDLDSSGFVDAHYAAPPDKLRVRDVTQRLYRGFCRHNENIEPILEEFRAHKSDFLKIVQNQPRLDNRTRSNALKFLEGFYDKLDSEKDIRNQLVDKCRG